jgi:hypothetical protein
MKVTEPTTLEVYTPDVPLLTRPVYWSTHLPVSVNLNTLQMWVDDYKKWLPVGGVTIDEASVLVPGAWHANMFVDNMKAHGWEHFNTSQDLVYTNPFGTRYFVRYEFLRHKDWDWRLEVMYFDATKDGTRGFSPLHQALWSPDGVADLRHQGTYPVPHLSFKVPPVNGEQQPTGAFSRAVGHLQMKGLIHAQTCQSTYGVFGYYIPNNAERQLYLKPRLNLRDALAEAVSQ